MNRLREILLTQYIGAVAIALVAAQVLMGLVNTVVQASAAYIAVRQSRESLFGQQRQFSWQTPIMSLISISLDALICVALIRWLYADPNASVTQTSDEEDQLPNERA